MLRNGFRWNQVCRAEAVRIDLMPGGSKMAATKGGVRC